MSDQAKFIQITGTFESGIVALDSAGQIWELRCHGPEDKPPYKLKYTWDKINATRRDPDET